MQNQTTNSKIKTTRIEKLAPVKKTTIDLSFNWQEALVMLLIVLEDGNEEGKKQAKAELKKMAIVADTCVIVTENIRNLIEVATRTTRNIIGFDGAQELDDAIDKAKKNPIEV